MDSTEKTFQMAADRGRTMARLSVFSGILSAVLAVTALALGSIWDSVAGSDTFSLGFIIYGIAFIFSAAAFIYAILSTAANREEVDKLQLEKRKASHHAFEVSEDVRFTAGRTFANYKRFAPFVISLVAAGLLIALLSSYGAYWKSPDRIKAVPDNTLQALVTAILMMAVSGFTGAFYIGQARAGSFRWLRSVGAWFMVGFLAMLLSSVELCLVHFKITGVESYFAWGIWTVLMVLGVELIINFIVDFYRPRTAEEVRPLFESSLLSLFTEPGGVMRNIANTLDYQFGFKVSGTYIYRFVERALFPALAIWLVLLWMFTAVDQVGPNQLGLRMRFGRLVSEQPLKPGFYFKLPWPFESINRYSCSELREIVIGNVHDDAHSHDDEAAVVDDGHGHDTAGEAARARRKREEMEAKFRHLSFWDMHLDEGASSYMVAVKTDGVEDNSDLPVNVALLNVTIPIQYRIRESELLKYAYHNSDSSRLLELIASDVATEYLASCSLMGLMATERSAIAAELQRRIQRMADQLDLGIAIVNVSLLDVHPAPAVVGAYRDVISAQEQMRSNILSAEIDRIRVLPAAQATANEILAAASAYSSGQKLIAAADAKRFSKQLTAYSVLPSLFKLRSYLDVLENEGAYIRKFIISSDMKQEVYELNFEESVNFNFSDMQLGK